MRDLVEVWAPNDWELFVFGSLRDRHGALNVHKVPARHKGDFGIDYYTPSDRAAYQCYAVQEPCDVADRAAKQKVKITNDIAKFCKNAKELTDLFGAVRMTRWVLTVPLHDSAQVNLHATAKTLEVRSRSLAHVAPEFEVVVQDLDSFDEESRSLRAQHRRSLVIPGRTPSEAEVLKWTSDSNDLVMPLTSKLRKRLKPIESKRLDESVSEAIGWFLESENALELVRSTAPDLHESVLEVIGRHLARLKLYGPPATGAASQILREELEALVAGLRQSIPNLSPSSAEQIARGTLVAWLMRCPLDYPPYGQDS